ncbi:MAG: hypothetical protein KGI38_12010 [Thaumarchaeota archaeon]|nr:hypothetical protein [Nitrososphaerota archaeon]
MRAEEYVSELLVAIKEGPQHGKYSLNGFYRAYGEAYDVDIWRRRFLRTLNLLKELLGTNKDSLGWKKADDFYVLFVAADATFEGGRPIKKDAEKRLYDFMVKLRQEKFTPSHDARVEAYYRILTTMPKMTEKSRIRRIKILSSVLAGRRKGGK